MSGPNANLRELTAGRSEFAKASILLRTLASSQQNMDMKSLLN